MRLGDYTLVERIGFGGMAEVYLAEREDIAGFKKRVVVKKILTHLANDAHFREMFLREAKLAARLSHAHIVQVVDFAEDRGTYFIAMEHVDGVTLDKLASTSWHKKIALPMELVLAAIAEAALGLHHAHTLAEGSLIHRDITPENIMINRQGVTKILDFGIAKPLDDPRSITEAGELKGKIRFLSPEQLRGERVDARSDVYSLGVTLYWLLTGTAPFDGPDLEVMDAVLSTTPRAPRELNPTIPPQLERLVMRMLAKRPENRPASAEIVYDALAFTLTSRTKIVLPFLTEMLAHGIVDKKPPRELGCAASEPKTIDVRMWNAEPSATMPASAFGVDDGVTVDDQRLPGLDLKTDENVFASDHGTDETMPVRVRSKKAVPAPVDLTVVQPSTTTEVTAELDYIDIQLSEEEKKK